jgi:aspartate racemase
MEMLVGHSNSATRNRQEINVKRIGLIGGLSPESTVHYYSIICREHNRRAGGLTFPEITIESLNLQQLSERFEANDWDGVAKILLSALHRLKAAGSDFAAILSNTPHNAYDLLEEESPLEILTIMEATASALVADGRSRVALLGTRPTMEYGFFQKHFKSLGIETLTPEESERREMDRIIWDELCHGEVRTESREAARAMIAKLIDRGVEGVVLACTELDLLIQPEDSSRPLYDTTRIHAQAILDHAST